MWFRMLCVAALGAIGCAGQQAPRTKPDGDQALPAVVTADASFALSVAGAIARVAWDDWAPGSVPFVIVYPREQWLFRSGRPLAGYHSQPVSSIFGPVYRAPSWTRYDGVRVPFSPPRFVAQADRYGGVLTFTIGAPSVAPFPASDWATVFAHEYFHVFQITDRRWIADLPLIAPRFRQHLGRLYRDNAAVRANVSRELAIYASWLRRTRPPCDALDDLARARNERSDLLGTIDADLPKAERALERVEGTARYVEERAYELEKVVRLFRSREPAWQPASAEEALKRRLAPTGGEYFYATGYALARVLDVCNPSWKKSFAGKDLLELVRTKAGHELRP